MWPPRPGRYKPTSTKSDETPGKLAGFCAVVADAGNQHFDVFIYGGDNGVNVDYSGSTTQDAIWVLSVPEFVWTRISPGDSHHGRTRHICSSPYPDQMLVVGWGQPSERGLLHPRRLTHGYLQPDDASMDSRIRPHSRVAVSAQQNYSELDCFPDFASG